MNNMDKHLQVMYKYNSMASSAFVTFSQHKEIASIHSDNIPHLWDNVLLLLSRHDPSLHPQPFLLPPQLMLQMQQDKFQIFFIRRLAIRDLSWHILRAAWGNSDEFWGILVSRDES